MATEANTQSFWEHLDVMRAANYKNCRRSRRVRYRGFLLQRTII